MIRPLAVTFLVLPFAACSPDPAASTETTPVTAPVPPAAPGVETASAALVLDRIP